MNSRRALAGAGGAAALWVIFTIAAPPPVAAQEQVPVVAIDLEGNAAAERDLILKTLDIPVDAPLSTMRLRNGVRALWSLGLFSSLEVYGRPDGSGQRLLLVVSENPRITSFDFAGNKKIGTEDLKGKVDLRAGQLLVRRRIHEGCSAVEQAYRDDGYAMARCLPEVKEERPGETSITLRVEEGPRVKISALAFSGNSAISTDRLEGAVKLKPNSLFRRKRYTVEAAREDQGRIEELYRNNGYRDAVVRTLDPEFLEDGRKVVLRYEVEEGPYYLFGSRSWSGNSVVPTEALEAAAAFEAGEPFSQEALDRTTAEAYSLYTEKGYLLEIAIQPATETRGDTVDVAYSIREGAPSKVHEISIRGNRRTKEKVIRREMTLYPGDLLRRSALLRSQRDIFALGFFEDVQLDYQPTGEGTDVDLVFAVKEKSTGSASGGVGYSSETGLTGFVQLGHPNLFGNGQSISLSVERGGRRENYEISFNDPWVFGTPTAFGFDLFNTRRTRDLYTETRKGGGISFGRPWFYPFPDYSRVYLGYSVEDYKFSDFDPSLEDTDSASDGIPLADRLRESSGLISSTYLSFVRNSTDNPFDPTLGAKTTLRLELAGGLLSGDQHYFKPTIDHRVYFQPVWKPSLMLRWRLGWLVPLGDGKGVPSTETFRLGGTRPFEYLRGYDDYYIVPEENVRGTGSGQVRFPGGRAMFGVTAELVMPIVNPLRALLFYDAADVWNTPGEIGLSSLKEGLGTGLRFEIPLLGQVGFDYAYGTAVKDWRFHFIIGPAF